MDNVHDNIVNGNKDDILNSLKYGSAYYKLLSISCAVTHKINSIDIINAIKELKNDNSAFNSMVVSQFAIGALDVIGVEKYKGKNKTILSLISSEFGFVKQAG